MPSQRLKEAVILVVDDVQLNRKMLIGHLQARGYTQLLHAHDGRSALEMTYQHRPDLVILDLMMPDMDGYEYCRRIRSDAEFATMPIIVQTALDEMEHKLNAFRTGASDYLCKPVDGDELEARVNVHLTNRFLIHDLATYNIRISQEMDAARAMQNRLMPSEQNVKMCERVFDLNIASHFETSSTLGGDCWGMRPICDHKLAIYMYDFSGHGISAAMNIFRMHTIMREFNHVGGDPGAFLTNVNRQLKPLLERNEFATMFYGVLDTEANCLLYATAAPTSPLLYSNSQKETLSLTSRGFPLGVVAHASYDTKYVPFLPGDVLMLFSDGLSEARNTGGDVLGEEELIKLLRRVMETAPSNPSAAALKEARAALRKHATGPLADDLTLSFYARNT